MAFRRSFRRPMRRRFRRNPYDVQRFHICRGVFSIGEGSCSDGGSTSMAALVAPDAQAALVTAPFIPSARLAGVDKGLTIGGMRFWCEWSVSSSSLPTDFNDIIFSMSVLAWIARVPLDPESRLPAYTPDPWATPAVEGDMQYDFLWTRMWDIPIAKSSNAAAPQWIANSQGGSATLYASSGVAYITGQGQPLPYRVKTKRRLSETDALFFGVSGFHTVDTLQSVPLVFDVHGQIAVKRSR